MSAELILKFLALRRQAVIARTESSLDTTAETLFVRAEQLGNDLKVEQSSRPLQTGHTFDHKFADLQAEIFLHTRCTMQTAGPEDRPVFWRMGAGVPPLQPYEPSCGQRFPTYGFL